MTRCCEAERAAVRITGGEARGRLVPGVEGLEVRPTASKVRQAFFNILGAKLKGCRFLDLCAGSGLMGIEALSRGAAKLVAVDEKRKLVRAIELRLLHLRYDGSVICGDVGQVLPGLPAQGFDVIFADPPYSTGVGKVVLDLVAKHNLLSAQGVLVIEHRRSLPLPAERGALARSEVRNYGQTSLSFFKLKQEVEPGAEVDVEPGVKPEVEPADSVSS